MTRQLCTAGSQLPFTSAIKKDLVAQFSLLSADPKKG